MVGMLRFVEVGFLAIDFNVGVDATLVDGHESGSLVVHHCVPRNKETLWLLPVVGTKT